MAEAIDIRELNIRIEQQSAFVTNLVTGMDRVIVGQKHLVDSLLIGLLSDGHILLEGVPGLAKTLAIKTLSQLIDSEYSRIQFTPDLLPADVIGTMIYSQNDEKFQGISNISSETEDRIPVQFDSVDAVFQNDQDKTTMTMFYDGASYTCTVPADMLSRKASVSACPWKCTVPPAENPCRRRWPPSGL